MKTADEIDNPAWELLSRAPESEWEKYERDTHGVRHFPHSDTVLDSVPDHPAMRMDALRMPADPVAFNKGESSATRRFVFWRSWFTSVYSWAIPSPVALDGIVGILDGRPLVELGAGNGYWAWCLSQMGVDVVAYDKSPFGTQDSWFGGEWIIEPPTSWADQQRSYFDVQQGEADVLAKHGERVLFLCWPPHSGPMAFEALNAYPGDTLIFIGEWDGGCNADDDFWRMVTKREVWDDDADNGTGDYVPDLLSSPTWHKKDTIVIPKFTGIHDNIYVFERCGASS